MLFRSVLYYISKPLDWKRRTLLGTMAAAFVVAVLALGGFFQLTPLDFQSGLVIVVFLLLTPSVIYVLERGVDAVVRLIALCREMARESDRARREKT